LLPPYYFPIGSEEDLIAKVADLRAQAGSLSVLPQEGDVTWMEPTQAPPENSGPPRIELADLPTGAGCAGVKKPANEATPS
jgi:hypothetical protein